MKDLDINNFVNSILAEKKNPSAYSSKPRIEESKIDNYDISKVTVPDKFTSLLLEAVVPGITKSQETKRAEEIVEEDIIEETKEEKIQRLIQEFSSLVAKAKDIVQEMTTCGMIGTTTAAPDLFSKKKKGQVILKDKKRFKNG